MNLLCIWHIEKNVLRNCKGRFEKEEDWLTFLSIWNNLVKAPDEISFDQGWIEFQIQYESKKEVVDYCKKTWLPYKKYFVDAWTENFTHFGNRVTSRAEGAHSLLKKYLQVSTGDFREVKNKICHAIEK